MVARLFWVRHGPTHERAFTGWRDVPADLSDTAAIARLNAALPNGAIVISSDLSRAVTTADTLTPGRMRLPHDPGLREFDFGLWDGLEWHDVAARDPDLSRRFWEVPGDVAPPQGESWNAVTARVTSVIDKLADAHQGADLIAVAHFGAILTHLAQTSGMTPYQALGHKIDPLSLTELIRDGDGWRVVRINHIA
jgi:broad specificity phosphatase PhoE